VGQRRGEKKKHLGQGGCSSTKRAERAHLQLVHWWLLVHSSRSTPVLDKYPLGGVGRNQRFRFQRT